MTLQLDCLKSFRINKLKDPLKIFKRTLKNNGWINKPRLLSSSFSNMVKALSKRHIRSQIRPRGRITSPRESKHLKILTTVIVQSQQQPTIQRLQLKVNSTNQHSIKFKVKA
jgi:hypothetical protein